MAEGTEAVIRCSGCAASLKIRFQAGQEAVRVNCPKCGSAMAVRARPSTPPARVRRAVIGDEPRPFRDFLAAELRKAHFEVQVLEDGRELYERAKTEKPDLFVLNVYLRGMLGVEVCEAVKRDAELQAAKVVLIGALFRANRYRSNPTNLYGADEYIEEIISADELQSLLADLFPASQGSAPAETALEHELDEARRLARIIVSDLVLYHGPKVKEGIRGGNLEVVLAGELAEARAYYETRVAEKVRRISSFFDDTLRDYVERKAREYAA